MEKLLKFSSSRSAKSSVWLNLSGCWWSECLFCFFRNRVPKIFQLARNHVDEGLSAIAFCVLFQIPSSFSNFRPDRSSWERKFIACGMSVWLTSRDELFLSEKRRNDDISDSHPQNQVAAPSKTKKKYFYCLWKRLRLGVANDNRNIFLASFMHSELFLRLGFEIMAESQRSWCHCLLPWSGSDVFLSETGNKAGWVHVTFDLILQLLVSTHWKSRDALKSG